MTLDNKVRNTDFSNYRNVTVMEADQQRPEDLLRTVEHHFGRPICLVIEDASHVGVLSKLTFDVIFPVVRPGGAYFVEDWGTGYWDSWPDGSRMQSFPLSFDGGYIPKVLPSHNFGMVGFVKPLVELTHETAIKRNQSDDSSKISRIEVLEFGEGVCMAKKSLVSTIAPPK